MTETKKKKFSGFVNRASPCSSFSKLKKTAPKIYRLFLTLKSLLHQMILATISQQTNSTKKLTAQNSKIIFQM